MKAGYVVLLALVITIGCGEKQPAKSSGNNTEVTESEPPKAKATAGGKLWEFRNSKGYRNTSSVSSSPAIGSDGTVYVGSDDSFLYAINGKTGVKLWQFYRESRRIGPSKSSPAIGSDGTVYVGSRDKKLYALNGKTGDKLWEFETGGPVISSPAIGPDGTVYVGSNKYQWRSKASYGKLYAIKTDSKGLVNSPWPMRGQNLQHTGRVPEAKAPVALPTAPLPQGKTVAWTASVNPQSIDVFYRGKSYTLIQQHFGKADLEQNPWWGYTGLNITDKSGNKYSTVWFGFGNNNLVQEVRFER